jgi:prepilin-type N-terminal cleavage/methylation domain-containing protein
MLVNRARTWWPQNQDDQGFSLVEVLISLVLLSLVLGAGGTFMVRGITSASDISARQSAMMLATRQMEEVRSITPSFQSGVSGLVAGRAQGEVQAAWAAAAAAGIPTADTYTGSGATSFDQHTYGGSGTPAIPMAFRQTVGNQSYLVTTLIGTCVLDPVAGGACGTLGSGAEMFRAIVLVSWEPVSGGRCSGSACTLSLTSLISPDSDPVFKVSPSVAATSASPAPTASPSVSASPSSSASPSASLSPSSSPLPAAPVAVADRGLKVHQSLSLVINVTANDSGTLPAKGAVTIVSTPARGTVTVSSTNNRVTYVPRRGALGIVTFTYTITDTAGQVSAPATVTVQVW